MSAEPDKAEPDKAEKPAKSATAAPNAGIPKWLIYGFIAKLVLVVAVTSAVVIYAL